jgi:ATP-dependent protease HslVU (ClpYQ) peptidase subunit
VTTIAFDGKTLVADTLATDSWGLKTTAHKIIETTSWVAGFAGRSVQQIRWFNTATNASREWGAPNMTLDFILAYGYPNYKKEDDDPAIILVCRDTKKIWKHSEGIFVAHHDGKIAIGSGRDYALMAMHLGCSAKVAVRSTAKFDVNTNNIVDEVPV